MNMFVIEHFNVHSHVNKKLRDLTTLLELGYTTDVTQIQNYQIWDFGWAII